MTSSRPIGLPRTVWLIARLALRRQLNLWQSARLWNRKKNPVGSAPGEAVSRSGTPAKSSGKSALSIFLLLIMAFNGFNIASRGLISLSSTSRNLSVPSDMIPVSTYTEGKLVEAEKALKVVRQLPDPTEREKYVGLWERHLDQLFLSEVRGEGLSEEDENNRWQQMHEVFAQKGAAGFTPAARETFWVSAETWPREARPNSVFLRSLSLIVLLWMPFIVLGSLGLNNKNLGEVEWNFEWLYSFPASARALFTSKLFVFSFLNPLVWLFFYPFLVLIYVAAGFGFMAIPLGLAVLLYLSILAGALCTFLEVALRKLLTLSQLKNVQALFTILGAVSLLLICAGHSHARIPRLESFFVACDPRPSLGLLFASTARRIRDGGPRLRLLLFGFAGERMVDARRFGQSRRALPGNPSNLRSPFSRLLAARGRCAGTASASP